MTAHCCLALALRTAPAQQILVHTHSTSATFRQLRRQKCSRLCGKCFNGFIYAFLWVLWSGWKRIVIS